jgi:hypothetical protein
MLNSFDVIPYRAIKVSVNVDFTSNSEHDNALYKILFYCGLEEFLGPISANLLLSFHLIDVNNIDL